MLNKYREISEKDLQEAQGNAYSIENMAAHGAENRKIEYVGSARGKSNPKIVYDYYKDSAGSYWYECRAEVNGRLVSMDRYIFGKEIVKEKKYRKRR